jgi:hypothetical protein
MRGWVTTIILLWLLCLTVYAVYVGFGMRGEAGELGEVNQRLRSLEETAVVRAPMSGLNQVPSSGRFRILHAPNGKWRLFRRDVWIADFETLEAAELGMNLCIKPEVQHYDEAGKLING